MEQTATRLMTKARVNLLLENPFFGFLALHLELREDTEVPTMGTNGESLYYNPEYTLRLYSEGTIKLVETAILHELYHIGFGHLWRRGSRDPVRWNLAADAVANKDLALQRRFVPMSWVRIEDLGNESVEEVYRKIRVDRDGGGGDECNNSGGKGCGTGMKFESADGRHTSGDIVHDHSNWDKNNDGKKRSASEQKTLAEEWKSRISQARQLAKAQGQGLGSMEEMIDELLEPKLHWIEFIKNFVISAAKTDYRILPPNKRYLHAGMLLPSLYGEKIEIGFAIDSSGSMNTDDIVRGLSEVQGCCEAFGDYVIHIYQADYGVQEYIELTPTTSADFPKKIRGRGGTSFVPVFDDIQERGLNISCLIYFTDLMGVFPQTAPPYPVLWLATQPGNAPFGVVVQYERENNH